MQRLGLSVDLRAWKCCLFCSDEQVARNLAAVNLLTREEKEHIIDTRGRRGLGGAVSASAVATVSPDSPESIPSAQVRELNDGVPGAGVGSWKRDRRYLVIRRGRRVYRLP